MPPLPSTYKRSFTLINLRTKDWAKVEDTHLQLQAHTAERS